MSRFNPGKAELKLHEAGRRRIAPRARPSRHAPTHQGAQGSGFDPILTLDSKSRSMPNLEPPHTLRSTCYVTLTASLLGNCG